MTHYTSVSISTNRTAIKNNTSARRLMSQSSLTKLNGMYDLRPRRIAIVLSDGLTYLLQFSFSQRRALYRLRCSALVGSWRSNRSFGRAALRPKLLGGDVSTRIGDGPADILNFIPISRAEVVFRHFVVCLLNGIKRVLNATFPKIDYR